MIRRGGGECRFTLCLLVSQVLAAAPIAHSYIALIQRKLKMFLHLLSQGDGHLVYFLDIFRGEFDQLVQVAKFEESARVNTQELSQSRTVSFNGDALQRLQSVIESPNIKNERRNNCRGFLQSKRLTTQEIVWT